MSLPVRTHPATTRWGPLREIDDIYDRMGRLWAATTGGDGDRGRWAPLADVEETDTAYEVDLELPGVRREDVTVEVRDRELQVTGELRDKQRTGVLRHQTRRTGEFFYAVTLPADIDADQVKASLHDGVLTVQVAKSPTGHARRIEIQEVGHDHDSSR